MNPFFRFIQRNPETAVLLLAVLFILLVMWGAIVWDSFFLTGD